MSSDLTPQKRQRRTPEPPAANVVPRLLSVDGAAWYLGVSRAVVLNLLNVGAISQVILPVEQRRGSLAVAGECKRLLVDKTELDELVATWRTKRRAS